MTTELQFPDSRHNHLPRCCCDDAPELGGTGPCPACPDHGELAPTVECPQCHQAAGRPHTEYCPLAIREEVFGQDRADLWPGTTSLDDDIIQADLGQTSQPATRTSQPRTEIRGEAGPELLIEIHGQATPNLVDEVRKAITRAAREDGRS